MDRNVRPLMFFLLCGPVALRKESVDRNFYYAERDADWVRSLSARRAWIEILIILYAFMGVLVALRKESVDRNATTLLVYLALIRSLSARRAWIEIWWLRCWQLAARGRSPQGERG